MVLGDSLAAGLEEAGPLGTGDHLADQLGHLLGAGDIVHAGQPVGPLDEGWRLIDSNEEMDILMLEDESLAMFCRRTHLDIGPREPFPVLRDLADDLIADNLNSDRWDGLLDENEAVFAQAFNAASEQMFWHVYFHHKQRAYYIGLATAPGTETDARFPTPVLVMLKGIEFLD